MRAFVTVGTTQFDALLLAVADPANMHRLARLGITHLRVQRGTGAVTPDSAAGIVVEVFDALPSLDAEMSAADLIICHAGAGTVREALAHRKPTVVVVNTDLMDNHQREMAIKLGELGAITQCPSPSVLGEALDSVQLIPPPDVVVPPNDLAVGQDIATLCGLEDIRRARGRPAEVCAVLGSGGHTGELLHCTACLTHASDCSLRFVAAANDPLSAHRAHATHHDAPVSTIPRSREVGQSYFTSVFTTLLAFFACLRLMWSLHPDVLLCNGPGTCVPVCIACAFFNLFRRKTRIVYLESVCRVTSLSLSGKILRRIADVFVVQWQELAALAPHGLVRNYFYHPKLN